MFCVIGGANYRFKPLIFKEAHQAQISCMLSGMRKFFRMVTVSYCGLIK